MKLQRFLTTERPGATAAKTHSSHVGLQPTDDKTKQGKPPSQGRQLWAEGSDCCGRAYGALRIVWWVTNTERGGSAGIHGDIANIFLVVLVVLGADAEDVPSSIGEAALRKVCVVEEEEMGEREGRPTTGSYAKAVQTRPYPSSATGAVSAHSTILVCVYQAAFANY